MFKQKMTNWLLFVLLSLIWGSSFILMKYGLQFYTPPQVATIRQVSALVILIQTERQPGNKEHIMLILNFVLLFLELSIQRWLFRNSAEKNDPEWELFQQRYD